MSWYFRGFIQSAKLWVKPIGTLTVISGTTLTSGSEYTMDKNAVMESTFETSKNNPKNEEMVYKQMESKLINTESILNEYFESNKNIDINVLNDNIAYKEPLLLDTNMASNWTDFYNNIDLIFTEDSNDINSDNMRARMERVVRATQEHFCYEMEQLEPGIKFKWDLWKRPQSKTGNASKYSGGLTKVLQDSKIFEKAGVSVSVSSGILPESAIKQMSGNHNELKSLLEEQKLSDSSGNVEYYAASVSSVVHPKNPHAPTGHFNYRYFEIGTSNKDGIFTPKVWWFGGGGDLSPSILYKDDCIHFHESFKNVCNKYSPQFYKKFKVWCDKYFIIKHRKNEARGIGGIFFDDINGESIDDNISINMSEREKKEYIYNFVSDLASNWAQTYVPLIKRHAYQEYNDNHKEWQLIRRGRYIEFNLVYDRGTKFGLMKPGARIESILMSLPINANWYYMRDPIHDFEHEIHDVFLNPVNWIDLE